MAESGIDLSDFTSLIDVLEHMPEQTLLAAVVGMDMAGLYLQGGIAAMLANYPAAPKLSQLSKRSQAYFWWAVKHDKLPNWKWVEDGHGGHLEGHPYQRTGTLGRSITHQVKRDGDTVLGQVGTAVEYAPWVIGPKYPGREFTYFGKTQKMWQAGIHEGRWLRFEDEVEARLTGAAYEFEVAFFKELERLGNASK